MKGAYLDAVSLVERLHRYFLEVVKAEIERIGVRDINNVQSMLLYHIGDEELTVGELTERGYYLGSNVSYNLKKLVEASYIDQARSPHDRRSVRIKLSPKGLAFRRQLDQVFERHAEKMSRGAVKVEDLQGTQTTLRRLEAFWTQALAQAQSPRVETLNSAA